MENMSVTFKASGELIEEMSDVLRNGIVDEETDLFLKGNHISLKVVKNVFELYMKKSGSKKHFHEFLNSLEIILPKPEIPSRNPELEKRIEKLKFEAAAKEYRDMTKNVSIGENKSEIAQLRSEAKIARSQLISVLNFVLSVIGTFAFVYKAVEYSSTTPNVAQQVIAGIIAATVVALSELYFLFVYDLEV